MHVAASHLDTARNIKVQRRDSVDRIALDNCVLTWTMIRQTTISVGGQPSEDRTYTIDVTIAMKDLIASGLTVEPDTLFADEPAYQVRVPVRQTLEAEATSSISMDHDNPVSIAFATLPVGTAEDGRRIATAIRHAAGLCKVPSGPF